MLETFTGAETGNQPLGEGLEYDVDEPVAAYLIAHNKAAAVDAPKKPKPAKKTDEEV